ncbi:MAG: DUF1588 domain-containing protein [Akkermansiaceae bacterium]|nr:DUF1588 domain-containing protein [Akkermansiaceae bacterium]
MAISAVDLSKRFGILTHPAWLASHSDAMDNAILRGPWIRERLLGDAVPDVPITVDAMFFVSGWGATRPSTTPRFSARHTLPTKNSGGSMKALLITTAFLYRKVLNE